MPDVDLVARKDFSYMTRRLKAGDQFTCKARDAKVLVGINLARERREPGVIPPPPASVAAAIETLAPATVASPAPVPAPVPAPKAAPKAKRARRSKSRAKKA